ncbi:MAG: hypothetical protein K2K31_01220, partial [Clostridia bacterium]|nr:hypothetical protein [Clostridia bacterium]
IGGCCVVDRDSEMYKELNQETQGMEFEFNKLRNQITNLKNSMEWEEFISEPFVTSKVKSYIRNDLFDFENYDYKIDAFLNINNANGEKWNTIYIQTFLLDSNNNRLKFGNHWGRTHINENCEPQSGIEHSITTGGYVKSKYNETVVCWGFDGNDGEDGVRMIMEFVPAYLSSGTRSLIYTVDMASNSIWRQQFNNYRGTLGDTNNSLKNVKGIEITNINSMLFVPEQCYIRVYRRRGGYNKYSK